MVFLIITLNITIKNIKEFKLYKNSALIMSKFYKLGYKVAIATNQSAIDRKILKLKVLENTPSFSQ